MPKKPNILKNARGEYEIMDGKYTMIGRIIPWDKTPDSKFKIQMGDIGGFYNGMYTWEQALNKLVEASVSAYRTRLLGIKRSANLIYKKNKVKTIKL